MSNPNLPATAVEFINHIGHAATMALVAARPACPLYVPSEQGVGQYDWLVTTIGAESTAALIKWAPGQKLYIPSCKKALTLATWAQIQADFDLGVKTLDLALKYRLSQRQIENILAKPTQQLQPPPVPNFNPAQGVLF